MKVKGPTILDLIKVLDVIGEGELRSFTVEREVTGQGEVTLEIRCYTSRLGWTKPKTTVVEAIEQLSLRQALWLNTTKDIPNMLDAQTEYVRVLEKRRDI